MVDRVLFFPDKPELSGTVIDCVFLDNIVGYTILQGATSSNPSHQRRANGASVPGACNAPGGSVSPAIDGSARGGATARSEIIQSAKRLHAKSLANEVNNTRCGADRRLRSSGPRARTASITPMWESSVTDHH